MRYPTLFLTAAMAALLTGCSALMSLNPFVADAQLISDPQLVGTWRGADSKDLERIAVVQKGTRYNIHFAGEKAEDSADFEGRLARIGDAEYLDLLCTTCDDSFAVTVHMLARVWTAQDSLKWVYLQSDWLRDQARQKLATQESNRRTLITSPGDALTTFLKTYGADSRAYGDVAELVRVK